MTLRGPGSIALLLVTSMLVSCAGPQPQSTAATATEDVSPPPPSTARPSETVAPIPTPTLTPEPTVKLGPEEVASSIEQVAGAWALKLLGGGEGDPGILTFKPDGTYTIDAVGGYHAGMTMDLGRFSFEGSDLVLESEICLTPQKDFYTCIATYQVKVAMRDGQPGSLRFVAVEDPYADRRKSLDTKTLLPAKAA